ncbi:MAG: hypothetical protein ABJE79_04475 [Marinomonas sp.]
MDKAIYLISDLIQENIISSAFLLTMITLFINGIIKSRRHYKKYNTDIQRLISTLNNHEKKKNKITQSGFDSFLEEMEKTFLYYLSSNISESAISYRNSDKVYLKSEHIYKELDTKFFIDEHLDNPKLISIPTTLVSIGVLGTFLGLVIGIQSASTGLASTDSNIARASLEDLLGGAGLAFITSLAGLALSLLFNIRLTQHQSRTTEYWLTFSQIFKKLLPIINSKDMIRALNHAEETLNILNSFKKESLDFIASSQQHFKDSKEISESNISTNAFHMRTIERKFENIEATLMELRNEKELY